MKKLVFTQATPARLTLQLLGVSFLTYAITMLYVADTLFSLTKGVIFFVAGAFMFLLREHVSNSDYFKEFDKHINEKYVQNVDDEDEPNGYT